MSAGPNSGRIWSAPVGAQGFARNVSSTTFANSFAHSNEFSMRDEVRNTQSHHLDLSWTSGAVKLRQKPVTFVSAGYIEPLKDFTIHPNTSVEAVDASTAMDLGNDNPEAEVHEEHSMTVTELIEVITTVEREIPMSEASPQNQLDGDVGQTAEPQETRIDIKKRDFFFFDVAGQSDKRSLAYPPPVIPAPRSSFGASDSSDEVILFRGRSANTKTSPDNRNGSQPTARRGPSDVILQTIHQAPATCSNPLVQGIDENPLPRCQEKPARLHRRRSQAASKVPEEDEDEDDDEDEDILADYIANMTANGEDEFIARQLEMFNSRRDLGGDNFAYNLGSGDENDIPVVEGVSGKEANSTDSGSSDAEEEEDVDEMEDEEDDDEDFADMDDETHARLLSKQEELGLGTDELVLFDSFAFTKTKGKKRNSKHPAELSSVSKVFSNAGSVADAFDKADLTGWGQAATRKRRSKQPPNFNVSDSELEAALKTAWSRDRERKKTRKLEREDLRAQGLLRKGATRDDLHVKYPTGFRLEDFKTEIVSFLIGSDERLEFPPLDKHARMVLHQIAGKFNLKSKSIGNGQARRPVLHRNNRTIVYQPMQIAEATRKVDAAARRVGRKYFPRADVEASPGIYKEAYSGNAGRVSLKALVLREGEIVGASAPELGQENKGRAMLEKMGWSKGMGLGTLENKGILEPVAQVVKKSKAGLGRTHM